MNYGKIKFLKRLTVIILIFIIIILAIYLKSNNEKHIKSEVLIAQMNNIETETLSNESGNTYYISAQGGATEGTDINNPMSLAEANKKTFYSNDKILFKSGEEFFGPVKFKIYAEDGQMAYIGKYGEGEKPIISGATTILSTDAWVEEDGLYKLDLSDDSNKSGLGVYGSEPYNIGFIETEDGQIFGNRQRTKEDLEEEMDFACDGKYLYVKCSDNPSEKYGKLKTVAKNNLMLVHSNTIIADLNIRDTGAHGMVKNENLVKNVYIHDCIIQNIGGSILNDDFTRYGNGIEFYNGDIENILIQNNVFKNIYDTAFTMQGTSGYWENIFIKDNIFIANTQNSEIWNTGNSEGILNYEFSSNIQINTGRGWGYDVRPDKNVAANYLMYEFTKNLQATYINNISFNTRRIFSIPNGTLDKFADSVESDNNVEYYFDSIYLLNSNYTINDLDEYRNEYGQDEQSLFYSLDDKELEKVNNTQILKSNDYNYIKQYYMNLIEEIKYNDNIKEILNKVDDFKNKYSEELDSMSEIKSSLDEVESSLNVYNENINQTLWDSLEQLYVAGTNIVKDYKDQIDIATIEDMLLQINDIGNSYINVIDFIDAQNKDIDLETINNELDELALMIAENGDLNIEVEKQMLEQADNNLDFIGDEDRVTIEYQYLKSEYLAKWIRELLDIYIDEYIEANPITITYSETALTNKDVIATINASDITITNNEGKNTYTFTENNTFTFEYIRRGKEQKIEAKVSNIDKKLPEISNLEDRQILFESVVPNISDENLDTITLKKDGQVVAYNQGDTIQDNGLYELMVTDKATNEISIKFRIADEPEYNYNIKDDYISNVKAETTLEDFKKNYITIDEYNILHNDAELENGNVVSTGDMIRLSDGTVYTIIVAGDINKDGNVTAYDLSMLRNYILRIEELDNIEMLAADANCDEKTVGASDYSRIREIILGIE